jgi:hypothetical protein
MKRGFPKSRAGSVPVDVLRERRRNRGTTGDSAIGSDLRAAKCGDRV